MLNKAINKRPLINIKEIKEWWASTGLSIENLVGIRGGVLNLAISLDEMSRLYLLSTLPGDPSSTAMRKETGYKHMDVLGRLSEEYDIEIGVNLDNVYLLDTARNRRKLTGLINSKFVGFKIQFITDSPFIGSERKEVITRLDLTLDED